MGAFFCLLTPPMIVISKLNPLCWPLSIQALAAMLLGTLLGVVGGQGRYFGFLDNASLGQIGLLVIRFLKTLAVPLIFFGILDALIRNPIKASSGLRLFIICLINVSVAMAISLGLMNMLEPGLAWQGKIDEMVRDLNPTASGTPDGSKASLSFIQSLSSYVPNSIFEPIQGGNVISLVMLAILFGLGIQALRNHPEKGLTQKSQGLEDVITSLYELFTLVTRWVVRLTPLAVLGLVAQAVGKSGLGIFRELSGYFGIIVLGLSIHGLLYYPAMAWLVGGKKPGMFLGSGSDAILTGLSSNSSLATVPVTLRCLKRMGISDTSARLAACAGTNFNNDGVTLYEAMTALFLAQAVGFDLSAGQQLTVVLASLSAGVGIVGIPEAGLVILPLVLSMAGLPDAVVAAAIPLIIPVDWLLGRFRSGVNVMSDMLVAILLDRWERAPHKKVTD